MEEHRAAQVRDAESCEEGVPAGQPFFSFGIENQEIAVAFSGTRRRGRLYAPGPAVFDAGLPGVFAQPVEAAVLFVGVEGCGGVFAETGGDC
jgi:hypothetical protein